MAFHNLLLNLLPLLATLLTTITASPPNMYPLSCGVFSPQCKALLYHNNDPAHNLPKQQIAALYNVSTSQIVPKTRGSNEDYLVTVPCSCQDVDNTTAGYFYDVNYSVQINDTFFDVSNNIFSGQAWPVGDEEGSFEAGDEVPMFLLCGCGENKVKDVVTYTVQEDDTLSGIATLLASTEEEIVNLNQRLLSNASFLDVGWVLFVPSQM